MDDTPPKPMTLAEILGETARDAARDATSFSRGVTAIALERKRQVSEEGWTPKHDDGHLGDELAWAAVTYAAPEDVYRHMALGPRGTWPWDPKGDKREVDPTLDQRIRELVKAGALIAAEIDRLERTKAREERGR